MTTFTLTIQASDYRTVRRILRETSTYLGMYRGPDEVLEINDNGHIRDAFDDTLPVIVGAWRVSE